MVIRQDILEKHLAEAAVEQLADDYARRGFEVEREVPMAGTRADLVARKGDQVVVFEVKSGEWTPEKRSAVQRLRDHAVREEGARFVLVLAPRDREKLLEIDGIEDILASLIATWCESKLSELSPHARVTSVTEVDLRSIQAGHESIEVSGTGSVELELQVGQEVVPFSFHILLDGDLKPKEVLELELDLEDIEEEAGGDRR